MTVTVDEKVLNYCNEKGQDTFYLEVIKPKGSCGTSVPIPTVTFGEPDNLEDYHSFSENSLTIYVKKNVKTRGDSIRFIMRGLLFAKEIYPEGIKIQAL